MSDKFLNIDLLSDSEADLDLAVTHVRGEGVIAYPTETVYGFGSLPTTKGVSRVQALKRRTREKPLIILTPTAEEVAGLAWNDEAHLLGSAFWPGALTLVLHDSRSIFPPGIRSKSDKVAVRVSSNPIVQRILKKLGAPLTSTSVNYPGELPAKSTSEVVEVVRRLNGKDIMLIDAGTLPISEPSTIVDCTVKPLEVLRKGKVQISNLAEVIPELHGKAI
ncbi:MAG: L-threonylcarbamoyladenylate synthase [Gemmatimonadota bacterium]|nr:L-threonylcarbamoyladenylate synthase [Gemmatimonadota bacterium]